MDLIQRWRSKMRWLGQHELGTLVAAFAFTLGLWTFVVVADEVVENQTLAVDRAVLLALRNPADASDPIGPRWVEEMGRDLTALGGVAVLTLVSVACVSHLLLRRKPRAAAFVAASVLGALLLSLALKSLFERPRPDLVSHLSYVTSSSFPSGHSMLSASVYLTLGALLARFQEDLLLKAHVLAWALFLAMLVGLSRIYVGVHWLTDVVAGWAAGAAWSALCWLLARWMQRRGQVERSGQKG